MNRGRRVAVTAPVGGASARRRPAAGPEMAPETLAAARRIRRAQLRRAAVLLTAVAVLLFGAPVLIEVAPWLVEARLFGIPGAWLAVAVLPYPLMAVLAWAQLVAAERAERGPVPDPPPARTPAPAPDPAVRGDA